MSDMSPVARSLSGRTPRSCAETLVFHARPPFNASSRAAASPRDGSTERAAFRSVFIQQWSWMMQCESEICHHKFCVRSSLLVSVSSQPSHAAVFTFTLTNKMSDQARSRGKHAYSRAALISQRRGKRAGRSDAHIASSRPPGVTRRVEEQGVCSTCVSGHVRQFSSSVRERPQLAPCVPRVGCSKQPLSLLFRGQVSPDCRCSTSRRDLVCEHWIHGTVKEARNVLFAPFTAREKLHVAGAGRSGFRR